MGIFLLGAPAPAEFPFNNGVTQTNTLSTAAENGLQFLNVFKQSRSPLYLAPPTDTSAPRLPILELDTNGNPTEIVAGTGGFTRIFGLDSVAAYSGIWVVTADGEGEFSLNNGQLNPAPGYGALNSITFTGVDNRYEFVRVSDDEVSNGKTALAVTSMSAAPNYLRNWKMFRKDDEALINAGVEILYPPYKEFMQEVNPGCLRSLAALGNPYDGTNSCNIALWSQRKPRDYVSYVADEFRPEFYVGKTTQSGNDFDVTSPGGFTLTDKCMAHVWPNAAPSNGEYTESVAINSGSPATFTWTAHNLQVGNGLMIQCRRRFEATATLGSAVITNIPGGTGDMAAGQEFQYGPGLPSGTRILSVDSGDTVTLTNNFTLANGNYIFNLGYAAPILCGEILHVQAVDDANTIKVSLTRGGAAIDVAASYTGVKLCPLVMLQIDGQGYKPMTSWRWPTAARAFVCYSDAYPQANNIYTVTYDETTGWFNQYGGRDGPGDGMANGYPPEVFIDMCKLLGAQPWIVPPGLWQGTAANIHANTDFMYEWMTYAKSVRDSGGASWFKPIAENGNEFWNQNAVFRITHLGIGQSWALWRSDDDIGNAFGKSMSILGQEAEGIFGTDHTQFSVVCGVHTTRFHGGAPADQDARLKSTLYVLKNGGSPAYLYTSAVAPSSYVSPAARYSIDDLQDAYAYCITNAGNSSAQDAIAEAYSETANNSAPNVEFTNPYVQQCHENVKTWAMGMPVGSKIAYIYTYEGAWSPDYLLGDWSINIVSISATNPAVITTASVCQNSERSDMAGNPAVVGMGVTPSSVSGMTQINVGAAQSGTLTFTGGGSADIVGANTFNVDDAVAILIMKGNVNSQYLPVSAYIPPELLSGKAYYVVFTDGDKFRVSETKGGAAITIATASSAADVVAQRCIKVTAVDGDEITLDYDASALSPGSGGVATFAASQGLSNTLRYASKFTQAVGDINTETYDNFDGLTEPGFTAMWASNFVLFGTGGVWSVADPNYYMTPQSPQLLSIIARNH